MYFFFFSGIFLALTANCAHNFFHQQNNWRMYYFDLSLFSSYEWRVTHGLSHHLFTNTIYDIEISFLEPFWEFLPKPNKTFLQRYGVYIYEWLIIPIVMYIEALKRIIHLCSGAARLRPENVFPLCELMLMAVAASSFGLALR